jgi:drug/metabolite transporter superfamily protein YnfA
VEGNLKTASEFPVFNGGPRSCLGRKMAELLGVYVIASLVWEWTLKKIKIKKKRGRVSRNSLTLPMEGFALLCGCQRTKPLARKIDILYALSEKS